MKRKKSSDKKPDGEKSLEFKPAYGVALGIVALVAIIAILAASRQANDKVPQTPLGDQETCGDSVCGSKELSSGSCPADCTRQADEELAPAGDETGCVGEGQTVPLVPNAPKCCSWLTLIPPKQSSVLGIEGICTAFCGNGKCNLETESPKNCPADCTEVLDSQPLCDGVGTTKEGWYQNDKILKYEYCGGCVAECRFKGTLSEGWYNACDNKQIKRMCN